jgi:hypothetical protein
VTNVSCYLHGSLNHKEAPAFLNWKKRIPPKAFPNTLVAKKGILKVPHADIKKKFATQCSNPQNTKTVTQKITSKEFF